MAAWLVRAGARGEREQLALDNDVAIIGWGEPPIGLWSRRSSR
jgi:hypothetical protein